MGSDAQPTVAIFGAGCEGGARPGLVMPRLDHQPLVVGASAYLLELTCRYTSNVCSKPLDRR
jgi:hypothetical protein